MQASGAPQLLPCGDAALVVQFGEEIDPGLNARVLALDARVAAGMPGVVETVPTYRSLLVHYDPTATDFRTLGDALLALCSDLPEEPAHGRLWRIPVVYGGDFGIDLESVAAYHGITTGELIRKHSAPAYRVYMMGFLPGFAYLGGLDPSLAISRRENPRLKTPGRHDLDRRHPGARRLARGAERVASPRPHAGAQLHGQARSRSSSSMPATG